MYRYNKWWQREYIRRGNVKNYESKTQTSTFPRFRYIRRNAKKHQSVSTDNSLNIQNNPTLWYSPFSIIYNYEEFIHLFWSFHSFNCWLSSSHVISLSVYLLFVACLKFVCLSFVHRMSYASLFIFHSSHVICLSVYLSSSHVIFLSVYLSSSHAICLSLYVQSFKRIS